MILAGQLLLDDGARKDGGRCVISPGYVRVDGEVISEVVLGEVPSSADIGDVNTLITPGFIDAHLHLPQFDMIGAHGLPLLRWLGEVAFPAELRWSDQDYAAGMTRRVLSQLLSVGTTGICAYATVHHQSVRAAIAEAQAMGMRGVIGQVLMDREAPEPLCRSSSELLDEAATLAEDFPAGERIASAITPRFAISCSESLLAGAGRLAREHALLVQSHLAETIDGTKWVTRLFDGRSYAEVYSESGLLGSRSILGHGIHLTDQDRRLLAESGSIVAHCPTANSFLRSGTMNRAALLASGVRLAIGSDIGAGYERSMVRVARAMIEAASRLGDTFPQAATAWHAITAGNADLLGWSDAGRIQVGATADLLVFEPSLRWLDPGFDPLSLLMFAWDDRWLHRTMIRGKFVWP